MQVAAQSFEKVLEALAFFAKIVELGADKLLRELIREGEYLLIVHAAEAAESVNLGADLLKHLVNKGAYFGRGELRGGARLCAERVLHEI